MIGPGKYDDECTTVRIGTQARGVILVVHEGIRGNGFSVQAPLDLQVRLPDILEYIARTIRADLANGPL